MTAGASRRCSLWVACGARGGVSLKTGLRADDECASEERGESGSSGGSEGGRVDGAGVGVPGEVFSAVLGAADAADGEKVELVAGREGAVCCAGERQVHLRRWPLARCNGCLPACLRSCPTSPPSPPRSSAFSPGCSCA